MLPIGRFLWIAHALAAYALALGVVQAQAQPSIPVAQVPAPPIVAEQADQTPPRVRHGTDVVPPKVPPQAGHRPPANTPKAAVSDCVSAGQFDAFKQGLNATWSLKEGKDDSVLLKDFPAAPARASTLATWANNIAGNLITVLNERLTDPQQQEFAALENKQCPSRHVYCQIAFRQNAVLMLLPAKQT